jgi:guanylate kinase
MINNHIFVLNGFSGSGKDTILKELIKQNQDLYPIVTNSSRPIRENEINGVDYNFISKEDFLSAIQNDEMLEYRAYNVDFNGKKDTWYYGVSKNSISDDKSHIIVLDIKGAKVLKEVYGKRVTLIYIHVNDDERKQRAIARGDFDEVEWNRRLQDDRTLFDNQKINDYRVENINLNETVMTIQNIIKKETKNAKQNNSYRL